jgi:DNA-binding transcriptional ArsR family regulator
LERAVSGLVMGRVFYLDLPAHLKLTLLALGDHAEDDGSGIFVGQARLARKTGASERAVRGHIAELREMGLIEKMGRAGSRGTDKHRIAVERLPTSEQIALMFPPRPAISADRQPVADRKPSASSTGNPASRRPATAVAAEPSVEPSVEPSLSLRPEIESLCLLLTNLIEENGSKRPTITKQWRTEARRLVEVDHRDPAEAEELLRWCQADPFWRSNIMSMPKFRAKYDQLRLKAQGNGGNSRTGRAAEIYAMSLAAREEES